MVDVVVEVDVDVTVGPTSALPKKARDMLISTMLYIDPFFIMVSVESQLDSKATNSTRSNNNGVVRYNEYHLNKHTKRLFFFLLVLFFSGI